MADKDNEKLRKEMLRRLREQGVVDESGKEKGLEEEGLLGVLRPAKKYIKEKAEKIGIPSSVTETVDMLTPDGVELPIGKIAGAAKALVAKGAPVALGALPMLRMPKILKKDIPDSSKVKIQSAFLDKSGTPNAGTKLGDISPNVNEKLTAIQMQKLAEEMGYKPELAKEVAKSKAMLQKIEMQRPSGGVGGYTVSSTETQPAKAFSRSEQDFDWDYMSTYPKDTATNKIERNKKVESIISHEAIHKTLYDAGASLADSISGKLNKKISGRQITRAMEEEANSGLLNDTSWAPFRNFLTKGLGYSSNQVEAETLPWANSLLTNAKYREMYKTYLQNTSMESPTRIDVDKVFNLTMSGLKSSYKNTIKKMNGLTEDDVVNIVKTRLLGDVQQPGIAAIKIKK